MSEKKSAMVMWPRGVFAYHTQGSYQLLRRRLIVRIHVGDEIRGHANASQQANNLENADDFEGVSKNAKVLSSHLVASQRKEIKPFLLLQK